MASVIISIFSSILATISFGFTIWIRLHDNRTNLLFSLESSVKHAENLIDQWLLLYGEYEAKLLPYWGKTAGDNSVPTKKEHNLHERPNLDDLIAVHEPIEKMRQLRRSAMLAFYEVKDDKSFEKRKTKEKWEEVNKAIDQVLLNMGNCESALFVEYLCLVNNDDNKNTIKYLRDLVNSESDGKMNVLANGVIRECVKDNYLDISNISERIAIRCQSNLLESLQKLNCLFHELRLML